MTIFVYVGNTVPSVTSTLRQINQTTGLLEPIPLGGVTVTFRMRSKFGSAVLVDATADVVDETGGKVRYSWLPGDTTVAIDSSPGPYLGWWHLDFGGGVLLDTPEFDIDFLTHESRRSIGPCTDWCSTQDVVACYPDATVGECLTSAVQMASELLFELSGKQFPGWCQSVIRPCATGGCGWQVLSRGHVVGWGGHGWDGAGDACGCGYLQKLALPGIAQRVVQVMIDGDVLTPDQYRLDPNNELVRTDGNAWPACQNMAANGDAVGAFQVTYAHGYEPPELGRRAAAQLAHEFWLACGGNPCSLPSGAVQIVRQGITITRAVALFKDGATGLAMVDSFTTAFGNKGNGTLVLSPDTYPTARRTA